MSLKLHLFVRQQYNMDDIDITDAAFSLDTPTIDSIIDTSGGGSTDYSMFIYIIIIRFIINQRLRKKLIDFQFRFAMHLENISLHQF